MAWRGQKWICTNMKDKLVEWLKSQQNVLDKIISNAAEDYYEHNYCKPNFSYDLKKCQEESFNLVGSKDLCYDRPNTAFTYSLWYHARRVNTFLSFFASSLINYNSSDKIEIFDLGAGVGAIQWSIALIICGMKKVGYSPPIVTLINIDSSPFMMEYNEKYLWKHFLIEYPEISSTNFNVKYSINSWQNPDNITLTNPWIASSYLFDMSDNEDEISKGFMELIEYFKPSTLLLLTSAQEKKILFLNKISASLESKGFMVTGKYTRGINLLYSGLLNHVSAFRKQLTLNHEGRGLGSNASWDDNSFIGLTLTKKADPTSIKYTTETLYCFRKRKKKN